MTQRLAITSSDVLFAVSAALGLVWWAMMWRRGALTRLPPQGLPLLAAFLVVQVLAWGLVAGLLPFVHRSSSVRVVARPLLLTIGLVLGNALFYFTPVIGSPLLAMVALAAAVLRVAMRRLEVS